jgi:hypothetical protein
MINKVKELYRFVNICYNEIKFRRLIQPNVSELIHSEDSSVHWKYLDVSGKTVLDLGCGLWGVNDIKESSPVYFKSKGAKRIVGVDLNTKDIDTFKNYFNENFKGDGSEFLVKMIKGTNDMLDLINNYQIESIKCDIEGFEKVLFNITKEQLKNVGSISVEYHNRALFLNLVNTFNKWGFKIINHSIFSYGSPNLGVITAAKQLSTDLF